MNTPTRAGAAALLLTLAALSGPTGVAAQDAATLKDLTTVIILLGQPCGQVTAASAAGDNAHIATCDNGMRYRVFVDAQGRATAVRQ